MVQVQELHGIDVNTPTPPLFHTLPYSSPLQGSKAVKDEIINYDAHKITPEMRARVSKLMDSKGNSFEQAVGVGGKCVGSGDGGGLVMRVG